MQPGIAAIVPISSAVSRLAGDDHVVAQQEHVGVVDGAAGAPEQEVIAGAGA